LSLATRHWATALLLAFVIGAVAAFFFRGEPRVRPRVRQPHLPSHLAESIDRGAPVEAREAGPSDSWKANILVVEQGSLAPIEGAVVTWSETNTARTRIPLDISCAAASTNVDGRCTLEVSSAQGVMVAEAHEFQTNVAMWSSAEPETRIVLARGLSSSGAITDRLGTALEGLLVRASPCDVPEGCARSRGRGCRSAMSDAFGRFTVTGLSPGMYRFDIASDGYAARNADIEHGDASTTSRIWPAGATNIALEVDRIRAFRLRLVRAGTSLAVTETYGILNVLPGDGLLVPTTVEAWMRFVVSSGDTSAEIGWELEAGIINGLAVLAPSEHEAPRKATVRVVLGNGYLPFTTDVTLRLPSELANPTVADEVGLIPTRPTTDFGTVQVTMRRSVPACLRSREAATLQIRDAELGAELSAVFQSRISSDRCAFTVPVGRGTAVVFDGYSCTEPFTIDVGRNETVDVTVTMSPPTGVALCVTDSLGNRVFGSRVFVSDAEQRAYRGRDLARLTDYDPLARLGFASLVPGQYSITIVDDALGSASQSFVVTDGEVTRIDACLRDSR
jgi:hypothetical protein